MSGPFHPAMSVFTATKQQPVQHRGAVPVHPGALEQPGYTTAIATFRGQNGPFKYGRDIFVRNADDLVYASRTKLYTDYVELVNFRSTRSVREVTVQLATESRCRAAPFRSAQHQRTHRRVQCVEFGATELGGPCRHCRSGAPRNAPTAPGSLSTWRTRVPHRGQRHHFGRIHGGGRTARHRRRDACTAQGVRRVYLAGAVELHRTRRG